MHSGDVVVGRGNPETMIEPTPCSEAETEQLRSSVYINRRTFLCSGAAAAVITTIPTVATAGILMASRGLPIVPYGDPWAPEILARDIAEHLPGYLKAEEALAAGDATAFDAWDFHYRSLIDAASRCHDIDPESDWERELRGRRSHGLRCGLLQARHHPRLVGR